MAPSQEATQIIMLHLKEGVNLETIESGDAAGCSPAVQTLVHLGSTLKLQQGFIRHYWGHQVEDPTVFVWSIDWKSFEDAEAFKASEEYRSFAVGLLQIFDREKAAPLAGMVILCFQLVGLLGPISVAVYVRFNTDPTAAFEAKATEIALYTLPTASYTEEAKRKIDKGLDVPSMGAILKFGSGGATGWVFETRNDAEPEGHSIALLGVYGYPTVDHHRRWRESPEHAEVMKELGAGDLDFDMRDANVPGGGLFLSGESIFHVNFRAGT